MVGLGETDERPRGSRLRAHGVDISHRQTFQPSAHQLPVERYVDPLISGIESHAKALGFRHAAIGRSSSSYHADQQRTKQGWDEILFP